MKWIALTDQLPPRGEGVLVTDGLHIVTASNNGTIVPSNKMNTDFWREYCWDFWGVCGYEVEWEYDMARLTHWMALPKLPTFVDNRSKEQRGFESVTQETEHD